MQRLEGTTTKQMQDAPHGAVYVWVNNHLFYPRMLAQSLRRPDLTIVGPDWLHRKAFTTVEVVVDHAVVLTDMQRRGLNGYRYVT